MRIKFKKDFLKIIIFLFLGSFIFPNAAFAYAGPGVAIGAIIVFLSVMCVFLLSIFVHIRNFIIRFFKILIKNIRKLKKDKKKQENKN